MERWKNRLEEKVGLRIIGQWLSVTSYDFFTVSSDFSENFHNSSAIFFTNLLLFRSEGQESRSQDYKNFDQKPPESFEVFGHLANDDE